MRVAVVALWACAVVLVICPHIVLAWESRGHHFGMGSEGPRRFPYLSQTAIAAAIGAGVTGTGLFAFAMRWGTSWHRIAAFVPGVFCVLGILTALAITLGLD